MDQLLYSEELLHKELISRVSALDGKNCKIDSNRKSLSATVEALVECTNVDPAIIKGIADQLAVDPKYINSSEAPSEADILLSRHTRYAKYAAIGLTILFIWSMMKFLNFNSNIKSVMHDVSSVQSRINDFRRRTGFYPHSFEKISLPAKGPEMDSIKSIKMGPEGQLLIKSTGLFSGQILLTPSERFDGWTKWKCFTNASRLFSIAVWLCEYKSSLYFRQ